MIVNILEIKNLNLSFRLDSGIYKTLHNISFNLQAGKMHALVGESGCGKSMTAMSIIRLLPKNAIITDGEIIYKGQNILNLAERDLQKIRGNKISLIPQDPMTSLNPLYTIGNQLLEIIKKDKSLNKEDAYKKAVDVLSIVKLPEPEEKMNFYPHELSGGMKQRVIIAMALSVNSEIIIADEPTTALDVTIQAEIMKILNEIKNKYNTCILFISHDLNLVGEYADSISVMYSGSIVEHAEKHEFFNNTKHPYSKALFKALPSNAKNNILTQIEGQPPNIKECIEGCRFSPRCKEFDSNLCKITPTLKDTGNNHKVACNKI